MQTLKNFIRETLIIESGDDDNTENSNVLSDVTIDIVGAVAGASDNPEYEAKVASINMLLKSKKESIAPDVNASLSQWSGGDGPGSILSDSDMLVMRKNIEYLLERDLKDGLVYPYRTALFLTGYERGITTYDEIIDRAVTWGSTAALGPIEYVIDAMTSGRAGGDPDELDAYGWTIAKIAGGITLGAFAKHLIMHYAFDKTARLAAKLPFVGPMWKSFSRQRMFKIVNDPEAWWKVVTAVETGTVREGDNAELTTSIIRPLLSYREGILWTKFSSIKSVVNTTLISALNDTAGKKIKVAVVQGDAGGVNSKQIGTIILDLTDLVQTGGIHGVDDGNEFVNEAIRLVLRKCLATESPEAATKTTISSIDAIFSTGSEPLKTLFTKSNSKTQLISTAELIDAVGDKMDKFDKFDAWLKQEIASAVEKNGGKIPDKVKFLDIDSNQLYELPTAFRLSIKTDLNAENFVNNLISGKRALINLTELFLDVVNQMTTLGKAKKGVRTLLVGVGALSTAMAAAGVAGGAGGGIAASIMGDEVDELTAAKIATDAKIRSDAIVAWNSILIQEPDIDSIGYSAHIPYFQDSPDARWKEADNALMAALKMEAGDLDVDAVIQMSDAIEKYKNALGKKSVKKQPTKESSNVKNEHAINLISSLIREFLNHN